MRESDAICRFLSAVRGGADLLLAALDAVSADRLEHFSAAIKGQVRPVPAWRITAERGRPVLSAAADPIGPDDLAPIAALSGAG